AFARELSIALERPKEERLDAWVNGAIAGVDLATSEDRGSGLIRGNVTGAAGQTEVDSSTKAEEAMAAVGPLLETHPPAPAPMISNAAAEAFPNEPSLTGQVAALRPKGRGLLIAFLLLAAAGGTA